MKKVIYIDNIRVLLIILVVLHHAVIAYGGSGSWYYKEENKSFLESLFLLIFNAVNQSFFMGMFFFLSALFLEGSYKKKTASKFITDRLIRLGIPLIVYATVLGPVTNFWIGKYARGGQYTFLQYIRGYDNWIDFGVLWFVMALLVFTLCFIVFRRRGSKETLDLMKAPSSTSILLFAGGLGVVSFLVRIIFPVGWVLKPLGFQLGHFPQYIALFYLGLHASRNRWLESVPERNARPWVVGSLLMVLIGFPVMFVIQKVTQAPLGNFSGGLHWLSLFYSVWEQVVGFSIIMALLINGSQRWNTQNAFQKLFARNAYAVYIIHAMVLVGITLLIRDWQADPMVKLLVAGPSAILVSLGVSSILTKLPGVREVV